MEGRLFYLTPLPNLMFIHDVSTVVLDQLLLGRMAAPGRAREPVLFEVKRTIVGQDVLLERMAIAMLAGGHLLDLVRQDGQRLGDAAGTRAIGVNRVRIEPGRLSTPPHSHAASSPAPRRRRSRTSSSATRPPSYGSVWPPARPSKIARCGGACA